MCVPAALRTEDVTRNAEIAATWLEEELEDYLQSPEAAFFRYLVGLERAGS